MSNILAALPFWHYVSAMFLVIVCVLLIFIVLLQKGRGGGLSGAFGGAGSGSAFGSKTGDMFTWVTIVLAVLFLLLSVANNFMFRALPVGAAQPVQAETVESVGAGAPVDAAPAESTTDSPAGGPATGGTPAGDTTPAPSPAPVTPKPDAPTPSAPGS
jgi:preprotein translocase subunit SecG